MVVDFTSSTRYHETVSVSLPPFLIHLVVSANQVGLSTRESRECMGSAGEQEAGPLSIYYTLWSQAPFELLSSGYNGLKQIRLMQRDDDSPQHPGHHQHPLTTILWFSWDHQAQWDFRIWWGFWGLQLRTSVLQVSSLCQSSRSGSNAHAVNVIDGRRLLTCWKLEGFAALIWPAALKLWCRPSAAARKGKESAEWKVCDPLGSFAFSSSVYWLWISFLCLDCVEQGVEHRRKITTLSSPFQ